MPSNKTLGSDQEMLYFLNEASEALFTSLTLEDKLIFDEISRLIVPRLADWFAIDIYDEKHGFETLTVAHKNPEKLRWAYEWRQKYPPEYHSPTGLGAAIRTGQPEVYLHITEEMIEATARDKGHLNIIRELGLQSVVIMPLKARNKAFGAITFVSTKDSERNYTREDLHPIESFANKVAIAIDNKRLYSMAQQEISRRKENEASIKKLLDESKLKEKRLDEFIRTIPGMVWETKLNPEDNSQKITFISEYAEQMMGYPLEDWYNVPNFWDKIVHPDDQGITSSNAANTYKNGFGQNQYRWIAKSGKIVWTETKSFVLYDENKNPVGLRGVSFDITRIKELENRKDEFISIASHELKTPITSAKIITQNLLQNHRDSVDGDRLLMQKLDQQLDKLTHLINSMLDVNRLQDHRVSFSDEPFDLNELLQEIVTTFSRLYPNEINLNGAVRSHLMADRERIGQVFLNLLSNAVKYSGKKKPIHILIEHEDASVCVKILDQGVGIEEKYLQRIFHKFFRIPDPSIKFISGMGIGLNIAQQIVNHYQGRIWVESKPGVGSTFCVSFPAAIIC